MKRIITIQDISCLGQCSLTVAMPIISSMKIETCIVPTAILSTHTAFFKGYTFHDLTIELNKIKEHWIKEDFKFDGIYSGYLGSLEQIQIVKDYVDTFRDDKSKIYVCDPAMADFGKLYPGFNLEFVKGMASLCGIADYIVPNITEACFLTGNEYKEKYDQAYIEKLLYDLHKLGAKNVLLTGVSFDANLLGIAAYDGNKIEYYFNNKIDKSFHGTGDIYASVFFGGLINGLSMIKAGRLAADFVIDAIKETIDVADTHWYGVCFEKVLHKLGEIDYENY